MSRHVISALSEQHLIEVWGYRRRARFLGFHAGRTAAGELQGVLYDEAKVDQEGRLFRSHYSHRLIDFADKIEFGQ